jgi:glucose/arabinose dehydrogenase
VYLKDRAPEQPLVSTVLKDLRKPHGLAFDPKAPTLLYIATETGVLHIPTYSDGGPVDIATLPSGGGGHFTRSLAFGPDDRLYVSIGSTCNACQEKNPEHASILSMKKDGSDRRIYADGLRNSVFLTFEGKQLWATDMGRDNLGDNLPPDEVNIVTDGGDYGWPICYGARVHDTVFDTNQYIRDPCADTIPPVIEIPAHSAPLGLAFLPDGSLLVAYHGSWNRTEPTGYKVVRWEKKSGAWVQSDFLTGFLKNGQAIGRPVDVLVMSDGSVLVSDDKSGSLWKVSPTP